MKTSITWPILVIGGALSGCAESSSEPVICPLIGIPSIVAEVRDQAGVPAATGATLTAIGNKATFTAEGFGDSLRIHTRDPFGVGGTFTIEVDRPWYESDRLTKVRVREGPCGVPEPHRVELTIRLRENAPPVRQVVLPPTDYGFLDGNISATVPAFVATADGVSKEVRWGTSDSVVVSVTQAGKITAGCIHSRQTAWVTAWSVVDPSVRDSIHVSVWAFDHSSGRCTQPGGQGSA